MTSAAGRYPNPTTEAAIHVSSLIGVHDVLEATRARFLVSVVHSPTLMPTPNWVEPEDHLRLGCQDVVDDHPGQSGPQLEHVHALIAFAHRWNRRGPLVIHCMAAMISQRLPGSQRRRVMTIRKTLLTATVLFAVPEHEYTFSRSLAAPMCLAQALCVALAARLQNSADKPRIPVATDP